MTYESGIAIDNPRILLHADIYIYLQQSGLFANEDCQIGLEIGRGNLKQHLLGITCILFYSNPISSLSLALAF